jgi:hypothetical protein
MAKPHHLGTLHTFHHYLVDMVFKILALVSHIVHKGPATFRTQKSLSRGHGT